MNRPEIKNGNGAPPDASLADYYSAFTSTVLNHPADLLSIHYGLWGPDTKTDRDALLRANSTLVKGCNLSSDHTVLDAGCGLGGTVIWLAQEFGVRAIGLTNCKPHVAVATEAAKKRGVGELVEFRFGDFMEMPFRNASFDAVLNHETYCYATDKHKFLDGVLRVLKPGGRWQALEGLLTEKKLSQQEESIHLSVQQGWRTEPLECWRNVLQTLDKTGFQKTQAVDLNAEVLPASEKLCLFWNIFGHLITPPSSQWAFDEFRQGIFGFHEGLQQDVFTYRLLVGTKPT